MIIDDSNPHAGPSSLPAQSTSTQAYMFANLPVGTELDAEQMVAIGCNPPASNADAVAYAGDKYL